MGRLIEDKRADRCARGGRLVSETTGTRDKSRDFCVSRVCVSRVCVGVCVTCVCVCCVKERMRREHRSGGEQPKQRKKKKNEKEWKECASVRGEGQEEST